MTDEEFVNELQRRLNANAPAMLGEALAVPSGISLRPAASAQLNLKWQTNPGTVEKLGKFDIVLMWGVAIVGIDGKDFSAEAGQEVFAKTSVKYGTYQLEQMLKKKRN